MKTYWDYTDLEKMNMTSQDVESLIDNMADISDLRTLQEFTNKRLNNLTIKGIL